jgi:hypothetical protein
MGAVVDADDAMAIEPKAMPPGEVVMGLAK